MATEKRLIDANALLSEVVKLQALDPDKAVANIITLITDAKTVEAVEVVRCKDCVYCSTKRASRYNQLLRFCEWGEYHRKVPSNGSHFCSHGKRSQYESG